MDGIRPSTGRQQEGNDDGNVDPEQLPSSRAKERNSVPSQPATEKQLRQTEQKFEERMSAFERSMLRLTRAGVIVGIITGLIFAGQLYEMISGSTQTDKLITAANTQTEAATKIAGASEAFSKTADTAVNEFKKAAKDSTDAANQAAENSRKNIKNAQDSFRNDQRAWTGVGDYRIIAFDGKEPFKLIIPFVNSGKSPAVSTEYFVAYTIRDNFLLGPPGGFTYHFDKAAAIAPQGKYVITVTNLDVPPRYDEIINGKLFLYFFGEFRYHDVYQPDLIHVTSFCLFYDIHTKEMDYCYAGNDMN